MVLNLFSSLSMYCKQAESTSGLTFIPCDWFPPYSGPPSFIKYSQEVQNRYQHFSPLTFIDISFIQHLTLSFFHTVAVMSRVLNGVVGVLTAAGRGYRVSA